MHSSNSQNPMDVWETDGGQGAAALAPMESKAAWMLPVLTLTASDEVLRVNMVSWMKGRLDSVSGRMREIVGRAVAAFRHAHVRSGGSRSHPWVSLPAGDLGCGGESPVRLKRSATGRQRRAFTRPQI
jgi:hypothetical protein